MFQKASAFSAFPSKGSGWLPKAFVTGWAMMCGAGGATARGAGAADDELLDGELGAADIGLDAVDDA